MEKVVFIICDAVRWDYLDKRLTPFLSDLTQTSIYVKKLVPSFGFCEKATMFSGAYPEDHGYFTAMTFDKEKSDFNRLTVGEIKLIELIKKIAKAFGKVNPFLGRMLSNTILEHLYFRKIRGITQPIYEILPHFLPEIALTEDYKNMYGKNALSVETIFDRMIDENKSFFCENFASLRRSFITDDYTRLKKYLLKVKKQPNHDLYLLYFGEGDSVGHKYGPNSAEIKKTLHKIEYLIAKTIYFFNKMFKYVDYLIVGDHGMLEVKEHIDVYTKIIRIALSKNLKLNKDYKFFLDSTMARIWFNNDFSKEVFTKLFKHDYELKNRGNLLTEEIITKYHLPKKINYYGDLIWIANPGVLIFPDFFHAYEKAKGMHGYFPDIDEQKGFAILYSKNRNYNAKISEAHLIDICPTLCDLLNLKPPKSNKGKSIFKII